MCMDIPGSFVCGCPFDKQTYLIYISIVNNDIAMILELQAVNHDLLVNIRTLPTAACAWTSQEVLFVPILLKKKLILFT